MEDIVFPSSPASEAFGLGNIGRRESCVWEKQSREYGGVGVRGIPQN